MIPAIPINYHSITACSHVDGPGPRAVLHMQGCSLACPGCQNRQLWDPKADHIESVPVVAKTLALLAESHGNVTITGGEPFQQPAALASLTAILRHVHKVAHTIVYTGYTLEQLLSFDNQASLWVPQILSCIDVLVDGPFVAQLDDPLITYRGSRNQRVIDVKATLAQGEIVQLDWDLAFTVLPAGQVLIPAGMTAFFADLGPAAASRRCGSVAS